MTLSAIKSHIQAIAENQLVHREKNFDARTNAIDFLEFHILDQIDVLRKVEPDQDRFAELHYQAEKAKSKLEEIDNKLFQKLQQEIKQRKHTAKDLEALVKEYVSFENNKELDEEGNDNLDIFINRLLSLHYMPEQCRPLEPEMVFYQKTPTRIVFELVRNAGFTKDDVFFDIGSGLGQVAILVNLLAGVQTAGIEFDPAFCEYSKECTAALGLQGISFINVDAREADYSSGTVFFMYTPFRGKMLEDVLGLLRKESLKREIRIITYGPCTPEVAAQDWLYLISPKNQGHTQFISTFHQKGMR